MVHLVDKDTLVAEIEKMLQKENPCDNSEQEVGYHCALYELQDFLNSIEVKEVDLKKESLTWEDIPKLFSISEQLKTSWWFRDRTEEIGTQVFWEEVLKRFKAQKGEQYDRQSTENT